MLALTGTGPDRLQEEKTQGITIEFGYVHAVEDGVALSVVDVPGHERFVRNMPAGVGVMDFGMWAPSLSRSAPLPIWMLKLTTCTDAM